MSNYSVVAIPATIGAMAGLVLIGATCAELPRRENSMDRIRPIVSSLSNVTNYAENTKSPTFGLSKGVGVVTTDQLLQQASLSFSAGISNGLETLGSEYLEVVEDNFWDLVLR
ncbi:hypothetical protein ACFMKY_06265 [Pseudomonas protegens]|uniref:hypothetical protein n=1 Tax=Pseudomonas protegens TaxID=380021 RepID=UPI00366A93EB